MNMLNFIDGMDGLAAGIAAISRLVRDARAVARPWSRSRCWRRDGRRLHRLPAPQLPPGARLHGRRGLAHARLPARHDLVQGVLKTAAAVAVMFPLIVLLVPILDTSFVVLKRLKYGQRIWRPTAITCTTASPASAGRRDAPPCCCTRGAAPGGVRPHRALRSLPHARRRPGRRDAAARRAGARRAACDRLHGVRARDPQAAPPAAVRARPLERGARSSAARRGPARAARRPPRGAAGPSPLAPGTRTSSACCRA